MYAKISLTNAKGDTLKHYHHVTLDAEFKSDCRTWKLFLNNTQSNLLTRPFLEWDNSENNSTKLDFYTDVSRSSRKGFGCVFGKKYTWSQWEPGFIEKYQPSIEFLELYALCIRMLMWRGEPELNNSPITIFCDNTSVRDMVNSTTSGCKNCMHLLCVLILDCLLHNRKISVLYVESSKNDRADALSRLKFKKFFRLSPKSREIEPSPLPRELWPPSCFWVN